MRFTTHGTVAGSPKLEAKGRLEPVRARAAAEGEARASVGPVEGRVRAIPLRLTVPFLGGGPQVVASIGPFGFDVQRFDVAVTAFGVRVDGVIGDEGIDWNLDGALGCRMELDFEGTLPGRVSKAAIEFADGEDLDLDDDG
jgi:hypothetical protein